MNYTRNRAVNTISFLNKRALTLLFTILFFTTALNFAQAQKLKTLLESGDKAFLDNDFFAASIYYNQAILQDSNDIQIQYKYAEASRLNYDFEVAERWYKKVFKADAQGKLFPECSFWLATIQKSLGKYKDAKKLFDKYAKKNKKKKNDYFVLKAQQELAACDYAVGLSATVDKTIEVIHLDSAVNSKVSEYAPVLIDTILYFSSLRDYKDKDKKNDINYNKIFTAKTRKEQWEKAQELDTLFNKDKIHNANTAFNEDFSTVYITRCEQKNMQEFQCEIYFSDFNNGKWTCLKKLPPEVNMPGYNNTQPAIGFLENEKVLFFASNRPGGMGKMDIWYSKINNDGTYGKAINAGKKVNSIDDEITPFYCKPCQELFFSSNWHKGLGGFDIFKSDYKKNEFGEPKNLGLPINSSYNDIYFSISSKRTQAYLSSNRKGSFFEEKESCCNDIYMFKIPGINEPPPKVDSTQIFITQLKMLSPLTLYFHNDEPDRKTLAITTTKNYKKTHEDYVALREQYKKEYSKGAKGENLERAQNDIDTFFDDSVNAGMEDLETFAALLLKALKQGEKATITIKGYCSPLASTDYNVNLAKRRISSLRNYFSEYQGSVLVPYINNTKENEGSVSFVDQEIGELKVRPNVSDDYYDTKNSIYSPAAAVERKIQIIAISFAPKKTDKDTVWVGSSMLPTTTTAPTNKVIQNTAPIPVAPVAPTTSAVNRVVESKQVVQSTTPVTTTTPVVEQKPVVQNTTSITTTTPVVEQKPVVQNVTPATTTTPGVQSKPVVQSTTPTTTTAPVVESKPVVQNTTPTTTTTPVVESKPVVQNTTPRTTTTPVVESKPVVQNATPVTTIKSDTTKAPSTSTTIYSIQVGSLSLMSNAEGIQSALKLVFKEPIVIVNENNLYKVRITGFKTREEAKAIIPKLESLGVTGAFLVTSDR
ncbi:MAG: SPOR domain-containing protein [Bacteroidia bacterium]